MADAVITIKGVGDFSDVISNVNGVQKALTKLKLPDKLGDNLNKNITAFYKEYEKYQKKISEGIKTQGDYNQVEKSLNNMRNLYQAIGADAQKLLKLDMEDMLNLDTNEFKKISNEITNIMKEIGNVKIDTKPFTKAVDDIRNVTKNSKVSGENGILNQIMGSIKTGQLSDAKKQIQELQNYANKVAPRTTANGKPAPGTLSSEKYQQLTSAINTMNNAIARSEADMSPLIQKHNELQKELEESKQKAVQGIGKGFRNYNEAAGEVEKVTDALKRMHQEEFSFNREAQNIDRQIQSYFGLSQMIRKVGDIAKDAFATVKELDKAMTQTAVVTNFSVGDMWEMLPTYTAQANQLGSTIKDVYEASTLYYQQGLNTNQAMSLANETLKMARIAGLDAAEATNMMTAALRGFNMEINQMSAQKVNDIYSELAAITASDTKEIGSAMERTASIANSANMDFATTSAFLAQMIETTREAPENLGTAMKTIVARFQEMKKDPTKLIDSEGVAMDANKVDTALKSIGVELMNTKGEFRDLDDVFLDISAKWDSLTQGQQRYIATIAAGSRQQSRFIAMMSDYDRTMELVDAANNSAGASQRQFEKTLDSMEAKLNKLKNAWDQFTMGLMNNQILKFGVNALTEGFTIVNKLIDVLSRIPSKPFEGITKSALTLVTTLGMLGFGKKATRGLVRGGAGWFKGETSFVGGFRDGWTESGQAGFFKNRKDTANAEQQGNKDGQAYGRGWARAVRAMQNKQKTGQSLSYQALGLDKMKQNKMIQAAPVGAIVDQLLPADAITAEATKQLQESIEAAGGNVRQGLVNYKNETGKGKFLDNTQAEELQKTYDEAMDTDVESVDTKFGKLTGTINSAGSALMNFGDILQGTPFEPFGQILTTVGSSLTSLAVVLATTKASFLEQWAAATLASGAGEAQAVTALEEAVANEALSVSSITAAGGMATLGAAIWTTLLPLLAIAGAIGAVVLVFKGLDAAIETDAEKMKTATDAAAAASDAYDSAKQETSELADSISKIEETDSAFDNLVAGTAEFNEQLITANEQIMELINKYPMLMQADKNYVTTDANGLMHLSKEGVKAVQDYQKQIQSRASAVNLIQTADLNALENQQKAFKLSQSNFNDKKKHQQNIEEAKLLKERIKAEQDLARTNAVRITLQDKELHNAEALTAIYSSQYEVRKAEAEKEVDDLSKHERRQQYADFHGYTYNKSNKTITDIEGNEIDYDDNAIKDELAEQKVLLTFEENAESLSSVLNDVDKRFSQSLDQTYDSSSHFISDILSKNIDTNEDLLEQVLSSNSTQLQDAVNSMNEKEMAAILGISADAINKNNIKEKRDEIVQLLKTDATNIVSAQVKSYEDLATMMAQSKGWDVIAASQSDNQKAIEEDIKALTAEQAHSMSNIAAQLKEGAGLDTMSTYINYMNDLYKKINDESTSEETRTKSKEIAKEIEDTLNSVDLSSAIGRLNAYSELSQSANEETQQWANSMKNSANEANLLGEAFDEFVGGDWLELSEKADNLKNSLGQIDANGIIEASQESGALKTILDSGQVSASGLATALQGIEDGKYSVGAVNSAVLQLLSSLNRLEDEALKTHNMIENFDAGIDYGEASDFAKDNAEKAQEYYDNGEFGNQQLQNYIKLAAGEERWNEALRQSGGDLEVAEKKLLKYVTTFKDGFGPVMDQLNSGKGINGKTLSDNLEKAVRDGKIDEELEEKFKKVNPRFEGDDFIFGTDAEKMSNLTTDELKTYLEQIYGVSTEYAELILEDWTNLSPDIKAELSKNDLMAAVETDSFKDAHGITDSGQTILNNQEIDTIRQAGGEEALEEVATKLGYVATKQLSAAEAMEQASFKVLDEEGNRIDNSEDNGALLQDYIKTFGMAEKGSITSLLKTGATDTEGSKLFTKDELGESAKLDLSKLITDTMAKGLDQEQAFNAAWQAYQVARKEGETVSYQGVDLDSTYQTPEEFQAGIDQAIESAKWEAIGEAIANGMVNALKGLLPDWMTPGDSVDVKPKEEPTPGSKHETGGRKDERENLGNQNGGQQLRAQYDAQQQAQVLQKVGADNEQIKAAIIESAQKMADTQMKPDQIAAALNKAYGTNFDKSGKDITTNEDGKVKVNIDEQDLVSQLSGVEFPATANVTNIVMRGGGSKGGAGKSYNPKASGQNNPNSVFHRHGTMVRGSRGGYVVPGRPTLTGEEGEELVWEPKRNEAYMVGSNGPQFANISKDAVVWNAKQTERIKKNSKVGSFGTGARGISRFGTMNGGTGSGMTVSGSINIGAVAEIQDIIPPAEKPTIPVKANLQIENSGGGLLDKLFGGKKDSGPSIEVSANVTNVNTTDQTKSIDVTGNITKLENNSNANNINATATVTKVEKGSQVTGEPISVKATASVNKVSSNAAPKSQPKVSGQSMNVTANTAAAEAKIRKLISLFNKTYILKYKASGPDRIKVPISANFTGSWQKTVTINKSGAKGINNHISHYSAPSYGSVARGRYGQLGPSGKGGLTLTGEKGFEIAWLPSENRSMILGANGPQMLSLPSDAVVYTHEQSEDILKQKSIPAGSHFRISSNNNTTNTSSVSDHVKKAADSVKKDVKDTVDKISRVSNWWENIARRTEDSQRLMDKNQKTFSSYIKELQATLKTTGTIGQGNAYIKSLGEYRGYNETQLNRANEELNTLETSRIKQKGKKATSKKNQKKLKKAYNKGNVAIEQISYTNKKGKSKNEFIDLSKYIKNGLVDDTALKKIKDVNKRKAVSEAANKALNETRSRRNSAQDAIEKVEEALEQMGKELYETFFKWKNELTNIWEITQKIEQAQSRISQNDAFEDLIEAQLGSGSRQAGTDTASEVINNFKKRLNSQSEILLQREEAIKENKLELQSIINSTDEKDILAKVNNKLAGSLSDTERKGYEKYKEELESQINAQDLARQLTTIKYRADGTAEVDFNQQEFENKRLAGEISNDMAQAIQDWVKKIEEGSKNLQESYENRTKETAEFYNQLKELRNSWADAGDQLVKITEDSEKKKVDELKKLSDSIKKALDELLNKVKKNLDDRRKQEDNAKTEQDISQKQQRLAALRADTSGGHQVEIAQLEKEIAEAQQNYQRSLEDQLLEKLQDQADEASRQRERQIELQEAISTGVNNLLLVEQWMANPEMFHDQMLEAYREANNYSTSGSWRQQEIDDEFEPLYNSILANKTEQEELNKQIGKLTPTLEDIQNLMASQLITLDKAHDGVGEEHEGKLTAKEALGRFSATPEAVRETGKYTAEEFGSSGVDYDIAKKAGFTSEDLVKVPEYEAQAQKEIDDKKAAEENERIRIAEEERKRAEEAAAAVAAHRAAVNAYNARIASAASNSKMGADEFNSVISYARAAGISMTQMGVDLAATSGLTWKQVVRAAKKAKYSKATVTSWWGGVSDKANKAINAWNSYKTGGLASYTGPAWLDGTPSKPELVLNARDTANFIALKDVLSRAIGSINSTESSTYGDTTYEININVEKLTSDYDVDKVAERVKKIIVKDSSYRNVTQVRNLR